MKKLLVFGTIAISILFFVGVSARAQSNSSATSSCKTDAKGVVSCGLVNPLESGTTDINKIIGSLIKAALGVIGAITLLMLVWGGFLWLTSAGNAERVEQGTKTMLWAAIGVLIVFSSYFIIATFTNYLTGNENAPIQTGQ